MKKPLKNILSFSIIALSIGLISTIVPSIVSCSSNNGPNIPNGPSDSGSNTSSGYHISGDFAKIYTLELYNQNFDFLSHRFDGNNQLLVNQSNQNNFVPSIKNVKYTSLKANNNTLEIGFEGLYDINHTGNWMKVWQTNKYIYQANNQILNIPTSSFDEPGQNYNKIMTNKEFLDEVHTYTNQGFDAFVKFMNAKWID